MRRKLLLSYIMILLVGTLTTGLLSFSFIRSSSIRNMEATLVNYANLITDSLQIEQQSGSPRNLFLLAQKFSERTGVRVTLLDATGHVLADSADNSIIFQSQQAHLEIQLARRHEVRAVQRFDENTGQTTMFLAFPPLELQNQSIIIRLAEPIEHLLRESIVFLGYIGISIALGLILAMVVAVGTVRGIIRPVNELTIAAQRIAAGKLSTRIQVRTHDEIEALADTFNFMASELDQTISRMKRQNAEMDSMLSGMTDGALAVGPDGEILLLNGELQRLFPEISQNAAGGLVSGIFADQPEIPEIVHETLRRGMATEREIEAGPTGRRLILRVKSSLMKTWDPESRVMGVFLLVQDITKIRKLENMRSEFVANVTHELRTPLTLIAGFVETLQSWERLSDKDRGTALQVIELETERLKRLINDLLTLSEIENIETRTRWRQMKVDHEIRQVLALTGPLAEEKRISLTFCPAGDEVSLQGNPDWLRQMMINLVENAIKYTPAGGAVEIRAERHEHSVSISVRDNGIGIAEEEHELIFQRFYRVDKVRGRDSVGTGLGLTIVHDIVSELGGTIELESLPGKGSCFRAVFRLAEPQRIAL